MLSAVFWFLFAFHAVITTVMVARAKTVSQAFAAHFLGLVTAPAAGFLLAGVLFGGYKGWEKSREHIFARPTPGATASAAASP